MKNLLLFILIITGLSATAAIPKTWEKPYRLSESVLYVPLPSYYWVVDTLGTYGATSGALTYMDLSNRICYIRAGKYDNFYCRGLSDVEFRPIGGAVTISAGTNYYCWLFENPSTKGVGGIRIRISGDYLVGSGVQYGFIVQATQPATANINFTDSSRDISIYNVRVIGGYNNGGNSGQGIAIKTYPTGTYFNRGNGYSMGSNRIINCYISSTIYEGSYVGCSHYGDSTTTSYTPITTECATDSFFCYGNKYDSCGWSGMNVGGVTGLASIHNNTISNVALLHVYGHIAGININPGTKPLVYNNFIYNTLRHDVDYNVQTAAISVQGQGGLYYNNIIKGTHTAFLLLRNTDVNLRISNPDVYLMNNTIDGSSISIWAFSYNFGTAKLHLWNSAISQDSVHYTMDGNNWIGMDTFVNKISSTTAAMGYTSPSTSDYSLLSTSILKTGASNLYLWFTSDAIGNPLPSSGSNNYPFGARTYVGTTSPYLQIIHRRRK